MDNMTPTSPTDRPAARAGIDSELQRKFTEEFARTQMQALERAPKEQIGIIQIAWFLFGLVLALGGFFLYLGNTILGFSTFVLGFVGFVVAIYFLRPQGSSPNQQVILPTAEPSGGRWSRVIPRLPIRSEQLNELSRRLREIRGLAQMQYSAMLGTRNLPADKIVLDRVRINVFLPDTSDAMYGEVCALFIPESLHDGMKNEKERGIRFRPGEGLTGYVFSKEKAFGALRDSAVSDWKQIHLEGPGGEGDERYSLTVEQTHLIDPELRWIVSFPLRVTLDNAPQTFGILNVDGFTEPLTTEEMQAIYHTLEPTVEQFAREFSKLDKRRITITVEDVKAAPAA